MSGVVLANADAVALFRAMLRIRLIEEAIADRYAEQEMRCPVHLSIGQEASAVGVCAALKPDDQVTTTHRCHAHYLAKGGDLRAMMAEIYGRETGCCGGRGGSMHLFDGPAGLLVSLPIVGSNIGIAVGAALAQRMRGQDSVSLAFLGDGSVEEGIFHESANFAMARKVPVVFVVENNLYACYTHMQDRQPDRPLLDLAKAHGMPAVHGDGNDVLAVRELTRQAVERARAGQGPSMLVLDTYRWREHCGPNYDNDIGYRSEAEFQAWKARCPVETLRGRLDLGDDVVQAMTAEINAEIADAFAFAKASPYPDPATAGDHLYA